MAKPVVLDLETQFTFNQVKDRLPKSLKVSVAGLFDYASQKYLTFTESELSKLFGYLEGASSIIGFNVKSFDLSVLAPYYVGKIEAFVVNDLLKHVESELGFRVSLDNLVGETLNQKKQGHGLLAVEYFRNGEWEKLKAYCLSDVKLTKELYEYGVLHKQVFYKTAAGRGKIDVNWEVTNEQNPVAMTLPW